MDLTKPAAIEPLKATASTDIWWHRPWVRTSEAVLGHIIAVVVGFVMMIVGLGLGVTMILLPAGLAIGLLGMALFVGGLFAHISRSA